MVYAKGVNIKVVLYILSCVFLFSASFLLGIICCAVTRPHFKGFDYLVFQGYLLLFFLISSVFLGIFFTNFIEDFARQHFWWLRCFWYFYTLKLIFIISMGLFANDGYMLMRVLGVGVSIWFYFPAWMLERKTSQWRLGFPAYVLIPDIILVDYLHILKGFEWQPVVSFLSFVIVYALFFKYGFDFVVRGAFKLKLPRLGVLGLYFHKIVLYVFSILGLGGLFLFCIFI
ncbi:hypothetical protein [Chromobacterium paludis]|uniref:Uncharacterized protein n=1 Tax=Chromobacterium paludis TaxID=2605945 RepID=A0A5C1DDN9_9NEIS|nr:hypothetical protein [Chromobacterium paludis]QEL54861.1 hypothetical protein FYK34_04405 [Chromobacterium paludis]